VLQARRWEVICMDDEEEAMWNLVADPNTPLSRPTLAMHSWLTTVFKRPHAPGLLCLAHSPPATKPDTPPNCAVILSPLPKPNVEDIRFYKEVLTRNNIAKAMILHMQAPTVAAVTELAHAAKAYQLVLMSSLGCDIMQSDLLPFSLRKVASAEAKRIFQKYPREQLPVLLQKDPVVLYHGWHTGDVIEAWMSFRNCEPGKKYFIVSSSS